MREDNHGCNIQAELQGVLNDAMVAGDREKPRALVIVPTYNERENIGEVARRVFEAVAEDVDLMIIDDGSPDGTAETVKALRRASSRTHLIERPNKAGLGTAYITAFKWALSREYWAVVEMDGDLSHNPGDVPRILDALRNADLVIGSRYAHGGSVHNWSRFRRVLSRVGNAYAEMMLRLGVRDATSGFRAFRTEMLRRLDLDQVRSEGYAFQIELTWLVYSRGGVIREVPIAFTERASGSSKLSKRIVAEALVWVSAWGIRRRTTQRNAGSATHDVPVPWSGDQ